MDHDDSNILLMFSGGLDYTGALWNLLQDKNNRLHLHHLHLVNPTKRAAAEQFAINNILSYVSKISSNIKYSESYHEYSYYSYLSQVVGTDTIILNKNLISDSDMYNFIAGTICWCLPHIKKVAIGRTQSDDNIEVRERATRGNELLKLFAPTVEKIYPVGHLTKLEIYNMLPEELRNMTWSCRTPVYTDNTIHECGQCKTCLELKEIYQ
jgi:7-cyano-7-deazaguanine synthase in queuosine biosynthesis